MITAHEARITAEEAVEFIKIQRLEEEKKSIEARILQAAKLGLREAVFQELSLEALRLLNEFNYKFRKEDDEFVVSW